MSQSGQRDLDTKYPNSLLTTSCKFSALCYSVSSPAILWTFLACNIITDLYIIWLPMPMLFKSTLPMATKIALATLFGCGIFVTIAGILRVTYIVYVSHSDPPPCKERVA